MRTELDAIAARGEPLAILWASKSQIYGRYGYGVATARRRPRPSAIGSAFATTRRPPAASGWSTRTRPPACCLIYERARRETPGMFARTEDWWREYRLPDPEHHRHGAGPRYFAALELDGVDEAYARYRVKDDWQDGLPTSSLRVIEAIATSPVAERELWRYLFGVDLVQTVKAWHLRVDHPLLLLVTEPRRLRLRVGDGLWLRIVDVERALAGRSYADDRALVSSWRRLSARQRRRLAARGVRRRGYASPASTRSPSSASTSPTSAPPTSAASRSRSSQGGPRGGARSRARSSVPTSCSGRRPRPGARRSSRWFCGGGPGFLSAARRSFSRRDGAARPGSAPCSPAAPPR